MRAHRTTGAEGSVRTREDCYSWVDVGFFKRLFSADYRAAIAAEAAGDLDLAAERYALAGYHDAAARMHLARAERASSHSAEIDALRDALHWAPEDGEVRRPVLKALGTALLARARAEGVGTERDRDRVREAAYLLEDAEEWLMAGEAFESIQLDREAARAYRKGGLVERLELLLARDEAEHSRERQLRDRFADYHANLRGGDRASAREALQACLALAESKGEYRRLLDDLEGRLIAGGRVELRARRGNSVVVCARSPLLIGRDALCDLALRAGGISRRHTEISRGEGGFLMRDAGSRNGTLIGGLPVTGAIPLRERGVFALGEVYELEYEVGGATPDAVPLVVRVTRGLDLGTVLVAGDDGQALRLGQAAALPLAITFRDGRPFAVPDPPQPMSFNGEPVAHGAVQLIHGDQLVIAGTEIEVL